MKTRFTMFLAVVLVAGALEAVAAGLITKTQAEKDALAAVHGGTVALVVLETDNGKKIWSVDVCRLDARVRSVGGRSHGKYPPDHYTAALTHG